MNKPSFKSCDKAAVYFVMQEKIDRLTTDRDALLETAERTLGFLQDYLERLDADSQWGGNEGDAEYRESLRSYIELKRAAIAKATGGQAS